MTDTLRDKLIQKGWVTPFNADTLVRLIEEHYADEPAVPEGREPAAVISEPSDAELLCIAAEAIDGYGNGINPGDYEPATECAVQAYGSELCAYARAVLARWGNLKGSLTSSPPADGEVTPDSYNRGLLPMIVSATGDPDEPELERIICSSISGGADYLNGMPRELSLQRITAEGSVFARYIQGPRSPELTINSTEQSTPPPADGEVAELVEWLYGTRAARLTRAAELLQLQALQTLPQGLIPMEYVDADSSARIVSEPSEDGSGGCWVVRNSRHVNPCTEFPTAEAAWDALQRAHALPLPEVNND